MEENLIWMESLVSGFLEEIFSVANIWLLMGLLSLMTVEIMTRGIVNWRLGTPLGQRRWVELLGVKVMILSLIVVAAVFDLALLTLSPAGFARYADEWLRFNLVTKTTLAWLIFAEGSVVLRNITHVEEEVYVPGVLRWVIEKFREVDAKRFPSKNLPERRWTDRMSDEEILEIVRGRRDRGVQ